MSDPEYVRFRRKYPKFPGVAVCVELLGRGNVRGGMVDVICGELQQHAATHAAEMIRAFQVEQDERVRRILLGILCEARLPEATPVFAEQIHSPDEGLRYWAEQGLKDLNTPESRKVLWETRRGRG